MVESTALEMRRTGNRIGGSNPSLSAILLRLRGRTGRLNRASGGSNGGYRLLFDIVAVD